MNFDQIDKSHILVVDDDDRLRKLLARFLSENGYLVTEANSAAEARRKLEWFVYDLMVLDVMMPGETGIELLRSQLATPPPALMLSALGETPDRILGLEAGAEDYLAKPFEPKELLLRVRAILRRSRQPAEAAAVAFGPFVFDPANGQLSQKGEPVYLTTSETALLRLLAAQPGKPVSREALAKLLPGAANERSVDVQVNRLRKKIEESERRPLYLQTVRGAGYVLQAVPVAGGGAP